VYQFFWSEFCSWYLEMVKLDPERSKPTLVFVFENALRLLHPFMPFITEELWQNTPHTGESIVVAPFPKYDPAFIDERAERLMGTVQEIVTTVRNIRAEKNVDAKAKIPVRVATTDPEITALLDEAREHIVKLAGVSELGVAPSLAGGPGTAQGVAAGLSLEASLEGLVDVAAERARLAQSLEKARREIDGLERKLSNASFVERAPKEVVEENRRRLTEYRDQASKLTEAMERLT
jgi:valyl-tRNA synthetase